MRSHFTLNRGVKAACAVVGAATMLNGHGSAQTFVAADYATNSIYSGSWTAGQNGGHGFGAWSFDGTYDTNNVADPGGQQEMTYSSPIGTAWTLFNLGSAPAGSGISNVGRAINGGLQPGQTFETVINNPTIYYFYGGFDICLLNGTDNNPAGVNTAAIRMQVFNYFVTSWKVQDGNGSVNTHLSDATTGAAGMKVDFTLTSTNTYSLTLTPLSAPTSAYTQAGTLTTNLPINWVNFRLYNGASSGPTDNANNYAISSMTIAGINLNIQAIGGNAILSWPTNVPGFYLVSSPSLGAGAIWTSNSVVPVVINGQYVATNAITGSQQYFRLTQ
jgi:hypothetical protein